MKTPGTFPDACLGSLAGWVEVEWKDQGSYKITHLPAFTSVLSLHALDLMTEQLLETSTADFPSRTAEDIDMNVTSKRSRSRVMDWIKDCESLHPGCKKADPDFVPSRLV
ncbi:hypothetical protein ACMFMF_008927 [Clarireedia jacksonii]